ncbi:helix-turn-helix domain-containing protein [Haloarcula amylolytica]|uniref:PhiH1 repressor-like protein n=1 Tax=Haloarcula amylolytica JCM 13557 TaxID=1227452 RepID=M0KPM2_9EURY|nr:PhiH1 repressor-like protein [Haloarcula amylolytica]EMA23121.1 PhiH1 repressor-like protein [Haloarcula amylolytica JCM 13557]
MRYSGGWMVLADDRILEYIREEGSGRPTEMQESGYVRYSKQYISTRCKKLSDHGLLDDLGNGVYVITERGERYLDGEIDTSEDSPDEVESVFEGESKSGESHEQV